MTPAQFTKRRNSLGLSQAQLAEALVMSVRQVSRYETGEHPVPKVIELAMWALAEQNKKGANRA